jgi:ligand-binding sensor domain-containing protein/two-component sensor histidine kinase
MKLISHFRQLLLACLLFTVCHVVRAEHLPLRAYTVADGLPHNVINKIVRDSHGFLWFCTDDGLSRFDGYEFTNYGTNEGLPHSVVNDFLETRDGDYWVATKSGLCRFNPNGFPTRLVIYADQIPTDAHREPMFTVFTHEDDDRYSKAITTLLQRRDGTIWFGTAKGLSRVATENGRVSLRPIEIGLGTQYIEQRYVNTLLEDRYGTLWVGGPSGLYRLWTDGKVRRYGKSDGFPDDNIHDLLEDHQGNMWVATRFGGLFQLAAGDGTESAIIKRSYNDKNGLGTKWVFDLFESSDGKLWVGTNGGLCEFSLSDGNDVSLLHAYTKRNGFSYHEIANVSEDRDGNLWLGTVNGAMKLARNGFQTFGEEDGIYLVNSLFESAAGELYAFGYAVGDKQAFTAGSKDTLTPGVAQYGARIGRFDGERFKWLWPDALSTANVSWSDKPFILTTRGGDWWIGRYLFPRVDSFAQLKTARPIVEYTAKHGLVLPIVWATYEDSRGDVWISTVATETTGGGLARWKRATRTLRDMAQTEGLPSLKEKLVSAFEEDRAGSIWIGFNQGGLAKYASGRVTTFTTSDGLPSGRINDLYLDRAGSLWIATSRGGVGRIDEPRSEHPAFVNYSTTQGLSSNFTTSLTEDLYGRIYAGTGRGLDQITPATGLIKHFTTADGLAPGEIVTSLRDQSGVLWFGTKRGMSRFIPEKEQPTQPPPILINGLRIAGEKQNISAIGETEIALRELDRGRNQLQIDFVGLSFESGETLRYQYRIEGTDTDWSALSEQRTVNFVNIAPGQYRFLVRAVNSDGLFSPRPAIVAFTILPPIWLRWWFMAIATMACALFFYTLYRYRISRLVELERIRTRIASDLHDDIGSGLSRLAILSEVARHEAGSGKVSEQLSEIAQGSRHLVDSMSDIVWVINPRRDQLRDLVQRMRRFASDFFTAAKIDFTFQAPQEQNIRVDADVRRQLFLIFKEAVNNVVRHSHCTNAYIGLTIEDKLFILTVKDNGCGFDMAKATEGNGLINLRERAHMLNAELLVDSQPGKGTMVTLRAPLSVSVKERNWRLRGARSN